jgi:hypothetical protein
MPDPMLLAALLSNGQQTPDALQNYLRSQKQAQVAQALMGAAFTPANPQNPGPMASRVSILSPIARALEGKMAGNLYNKYYDTQANMLRGLYSNGGGNAAPPTADQALQQTPAAPVDLTQPGSLASSLTGQVNGAAQQMGQPQQSPDDQLIPGSDMTMGQARIRSMLGDPTALETYKHGLATLGAVSSEQGNLNAAGVSPEERRLINQRLVQKSAYIPSEQERVNSVMRDPITHEVIGVNPEAPPGAMNQYVGSQFAGQAPIPGGMESLQRSKEVQTAAQTANTPIHVGTDAQGRELYAFPHPPGLSGPTGGVAAVTAPKSYFPGSGSGGQPASPAVLTAQKTGAEQGQAYAQQLSKNATNATEVRRSLSELRNLAIQAPPAAFNQGKMTLGSYMIAAGADPQTVANFLKVDVGALQAAQKQTATLAVNKIHEMTSRGTNFDLDTFMRNNPNLNMAEPAAFNRVVDYMDKQAKEEIAKQKDFVNWKQGKSPDDWETDHTAHWLESQNQEIEKGRYNSPNPGSNAPSIEEIRAELRHRGVLK